ncbi:copper chaperone PCu(A)C [uncultured Tateyamaria sp.]|uniref:copper chaperone PCu(A)C n=1 Tax=uncultured Tateyamaria sp. TaxID=455651 RepID=UPI002633D543|nr:copper chaperone PCu(A)C [uncultured Tateyamaria sp.]
MSLRTQALAFAAATLMALPAAADSFMAMEPYARAASPAAKSGAAFIPLHNMSGQDDRLIAARSDAAQRVELHTHIDAGDGILQMREIEGGIPVAAGEMIEMRRGGQHVMLMGLTGPLEQDAEIAVTLVFERAGEVVVTVPVDNERAPKDGAHSH